MYGELIENNKMKGKINLILLEKITKCKIFIPKLYYIYINK